MKKLIILAILALVVNISKAQKSDTTKADYLYTAGAHLKLSTNYAVAGTVALLGGYYMYREYYVYNGNPGVYASGPLHTVGGISMIVGGVLITGSVIYKYSAIKYFKLAAQQNGGKEIGLLYFKSTPSSIGLGIKF